MTLEPFACIAGGLLGSAHCIGMCGGFAAAIGAARPRFAAALASQLVYSAGRIFTYAFLGAAAGAVGARLSRASDTLVNVQQVMSIIAGAAMIIVAVAVLLGRSLQPSIARGRVSSLLTRAAQPVFRTFITGPSRWNFLLAGVFTGFLPCGLLYAFLALAMATAHPLAGLATMVLFGIGTVPAMVAVGCGGALAGRHARARLHQLAACFVLLLGGATILRALPNAPCHQLMPKDHDPSSACQCHP